LFNDINCPVLCKNFQKSKRTSIIKVTISFSEILAFCTSKQRNYRGLLSGWLYYFIDFFILPCCDIFCYNFQSF